MEQNEISNKHAFNDKDHKPYTNFVANLKTHMRESSMEKDRENPNNEDNNNPKIKGDIFIYPIPLTQTISIKNNLGCEEKTIDFPLISALSYFLDKSAFCNYKKNFMYQVE
jgi:hypothetical protein